MIRDQFASALVIGLAGVRLGRYSDGLGEKAGTATIQVPVMMCAEEARKDGASP